ncbi:hypothetical protein PROP_00084 [Propionicimonas sp. T2.31MG-18]|uniref:hypothetical protein n=1 Tax=Propionicimonas sp. T2.31MG-18 TaxID=3157620 RepID=UPI0035E761E5
MSTTRVRLLAGYSVLVALLAGTAAAIGITQRGSGATAEATSILGERYSYAIDGVYAHNAVRVVAEGVGWDAVTLFLAVPALLVAAVFVARGSLRARLAALGLFGYLAYQYLMYAMFWAVGPLFPLFVVLYPSALLGIAWIVGTLDTRALAAAVGRGFPRRTLAVFAAVMSAMLAAMWVPRIAAGIAGDPVGANLLGTPTLTVQALDLGLVVPLSLATAVLVWRRHRAGYVLGALFTVKAVTMAGAIVAMLVSAWMVEGTLEVVPFAIFGAATTFAGVLAARVLLAVPDRLAAVPPVPEPVSGR